MYCIEGGSTKAIRIASTSSETEMANLFENPPSEQIEVIIKCHRFLGQSALVPDRPKGVTLSTTADEIIKMLDIKVRNPTLYYEDETTANDGAGGGILRSCPDTLVFADTVSPGKYTKRALLRKRIIFKKSQTVREFKQTLRDHLRYEAAESNQLVLYIVDGMLFGHNITKNVCNFVDQSPSD